MDMTPCSMYDIPFHYVYDTLFHYAYYTPFHYTYNTLIHYAYDTPFHYIYNTLFHYAYDTTAHREGGGQHGGGDKEWTACTYCVGGNSPSEKISGNIATPTI